jgi:hypothetical protein
VDDLSEKDRQLIDRVQRLERLAWRSITLAKDIWEALSQLERMSFIEERIRTLAFLEATPAR